MGGGGGGQNQKKIRKKNLPRHSAKKKIPSLEDRPKYFQPSSEKKYIFLL